MEKLLVDIFKARLAEWISYTKPVSDPLKPPAWLRIENPNPASPAVLS
jgi:hypothetical protein